MPSSSGASAALTRPQLPSSLRGAKPAGGGGLHRTQLPAKRLRLSRSRPPRPESSHLSGDGGWGAARPCSGSRCFFHHSEDARAGIAGSARRSAASYWPGRTLHTQQSAKETESAALPSRPAPPLPRGTSRFWPTRYRGRGSPSRCRAKAAPGRMLLPDSPYAERLQRARASLCAAAASLLRVGARGRPSLRLLPFAALPSSSARPVPAPLAEPGSSRRRRRRLGDRRCGARFTATTLGQPTPRPRL